MTDRDYHTRLALYVTVAFLAAIYDKWGTMAEAGLYEWGGLLIYAVLQSALTWRAFIDKSPSMRFSKTQNFVPNVTDA